MSQAAHQGLFAFDGETFHFHFQETPELDHVNWFEKIGLPSAGPEYDALLRGKVWEDLDTDQTFVGFYGTAYLSNRRYELIVSTFEIDEERLVEKMLTEAY
jgi:hypothetical protein